MAEIFDERERRLWAAVEAQQLGRGGISTVAKATGLSRTTIYQGLNELSECSAGAGLRRDRIRAEGGGRKALTAKDPELLESLERLVEPSTCGDAQSALRWTCKSTRQLSQALHRAGHPVGRQTVSELLAALGYSLQGNRKTREGSAHEDRDAQFGHINAQSHDTRLRTLMLLAQHGELCVCELTQAIVVSQPHLSRHLGQLRELGLVADRRAGLWVYYRIHPRLPAWAQAVIRETHAGLRHSKPFLSDLTQLSAMPNRPEAPRCV